MFEQNLKKGRMEKRKKKEKRRKKERKNICQDISAY